MRDWGVFWFCLNKLKTGYFATASVTKQPVTYQAELGYPNILGFVGRRNQLSSLGSMIYVWFGEEPQPTTLDQSA